MGRNKLSKFEDNEKDSRLLQEGKADFGNIKGCWAKNQFKNSKPITIEVGCGKGEYTVGLAQKFPHKNFVGIDIKGSRMWTGLRKADENKLNNVAFLRCKIEMISDFFTEGEVQEIWVTFPDPRPKDRDIKRRLTSPKFLELYKKILAKNGWVHFKTDNKALFEYTLNETLPEFKIQNLKHTFDLYNSDLLDDIRSIKTTYEQKFLNEGFKINYLSFQFSE